MTFWENILPFSGTKLYSCEMFLFSVGTNGVGIDCYKHKSNISGHIFKVDEKKIRILGPTLSFVITHVIN